MKVRLYRISIPDPAGSTYRIQLPQERHPCQHAPIHQEGEAVRRGEREEEAAPAHKGAGPLLPAAPQHPTEDSVEAIPVCGVGGKEEVGGGVRSRRTLTSEGAGWWSAAPHNPAEKGIE